MVRRIAPGVACREVAAVLVFDPTLPSLPARIAVRANQSLNFSYAPPAAAGFNLGDCNAACAALA
jgi:hypothetical protein